MGKLRLLHDTQVLLWTVLEPFDRLLTAKAWSLDLELASTAAIFSGFEE